MSNELQIFSNPEFGNIRAIEIDGEPWMVGKDVAEILGYVKPRNAIATHVDDDDKALAPIQGGCSTGKQDTAIINESGLYSLILSSKLPSAKKFKRWVTSEVLPAIRKTGGYVIPKDYPSALRALADAEEKRLALAAENEAQRQVIADFQPVKQYVDTILASNETMTVTQIAADYDMSARQLNRILHDAGIQHKVNGQWILYKKHMGMGYTKSRTINITRSDGIPDTVINTEWSQKGRLLIHKILTANGIVAIMDRAA